MITFVHQWAPCSLIIWYACASIAWTAWICDYNFVVFNCLSLICIRIIRFYFLKKQIKKFINFIILIPKDPAHMPRDFLSLKNLLRRFGPGNKLLHVKLWTKIVPGHVFGVYWFIIKWEIYLRGNCVINTIIPVKKPIKSNINKNHIQHGNE